MLTWERLQEKWEVWAFHLSLPRVPLEGTTRWEPQLDKKLKAVSGGAKSGLTKGNPEGLNDGLVGDYLQICCATFI